MEAVEPVWIGMTCWQNMMVCGAIWTLLFRLNNNYCVSHALLVAHESWRQSSSWGDMVEEEPSRPPGHGIHMHEKLSSPSRKRFELCVEVFVFGINLHHRSCWKKQMICFPVLDRTIAESKKKHEEKQLKAQQLRDKLREEKTLKLQKLLERVSELCKDDRNDFTEPISNPSPT